MPQRCSKNIGPTCPTTATCETSRLTQSMRKLICLQQVFRVNLSQMPARGAAVQTKETYSRNCCELSANYDHKQSSWKMCQDCFPFMAENSLEKFLLHWGRSGMIVSGISYLRVLSALHIDEIAYGLLEQGITYEKAEKISLSETLPLLQKIVSSMVGFDAKGSSEVLLREVFQYCAVEISKCSNGRACQNVSERSDDSPDSKKDKCGLGESAPTIENGYQIAAWRVATSQRLFDDLGRFIGETSADRRASGDCPENAATSVTTGGIDSSHKRDEARQPTGKSGPDETFPTQQDSLSAVVDGIAVSPERTDNLSGRYIYFFFQNGKIIETCVVMKAYQLAPLVRIIGATESGLWPTPRSSENENRSMKPTPSQLAGKHGMYLATAVQMFPTPKSRDWKGQNERGQHAPNDCLPNFIGGGKLSPLFVEWLMGFPPEWTDLNA